MEYRIQLILAFVILFITSLKGQAFASGQQIDLAAETEPLVVGIFPRRSPSDTLQRFTPLIRYLETTLQRPVRLVTSKDYAHFSKRLNSGQFDLVHFNQYHYIKAHDEMGYEVIAQNEEFGNKTLRAAIYSKKDSGINRLQDLRGKTISFGGSKQAIISYIIPTYMLRNAGLKEGDYIEKIVRTPPNALLFTYSGMADAAGAGDKILELPLIKKMVNSSNIKIVALSEEFAHLPWAIKIDLDPGLSAKLRSALLQLKISQEGQEILNSAALTALNPVSDSDYDPLRKIIGSVVRPADE